MSGPVAAFFSDARKRAEAETIPEHILHFLHAHSRCAAMPFTEWSLEVRTACAIDRMHREAKARRTEISALSPTADCELLSKVEPGTLLVTFHGAFLTLALSLFDKFVERGQKVSRRAATRDSRSALFEVSRRIEEGDCALFAPDGPLGAAFSSVQVCGVDISVSDGAAFATHTIGCPVAWYTVVRSTHGFRVKLDQGPQKRAGESFADYKQRFHEFYRSRIEDILTGDPRHIVLRPRWRQNFMTAQAKR